jgi:hypothetical protein
MALLLFIHNKVMDKDYEISARMYVTERFYARNRSG